MNERNKYRVILSEQAAQMLVSYTISLAQTSTNAAECLLQPLKKRQNH